MLETCSNYTSAFDLQFSSSKTTYMYFSKNKDEHNIYFMNSPIELIKSTQLLGVHISKDITNRNITSSVHKYYARVNSVLYDFRNVPCQVNAKLLSIYCLDLYGSQLWNFSSTDVQTFFVAWRKSIRRLWILPTTTHCLLLPHINDCISIEFVLGQRCAKFIWSCLNSSNTIIETIAISAISRGNSTIGDNSRYLSYKYIIGFHIWMLSLNDVVKCISLYMSNQDNSLYFAHGTIIRDLCLARDNHYQSPHLLSYTKIVMLIEQL